MKSRTKDHTRNRHLRWIIFTFSVFALSSYGSTFQARRASEPNSADAFTRAVHQYNANRFTDAQNLFSSVTGAHAQDAKAYLGKINSYKEALETAQTMLNRKEDEMDTASLGFTIREIQRALSIKADGPYHPAELLTRAKQLQAKIAQGERARAAVRDQELCRKTLDASNKHLYQEAKRYSCLVAYDDPSFPCSGNEAAYICQEMKELAASHPGKSPAPSIEDSASDVFTRAKNAYDSNDFQQAQQLFEQVTGEHHGEAKEFLDKIMRYNSAIEQAADANRASKYDDARLRYRQAASIKADGPGKPEEQAAMVDLQQGIDEFYSGRYPEAEQFLSTYNQESPGKADLAHFYLGASKLAQFYLAGGQDRSLERRALDEFREARKNGFSAEGQPVSPKILTAYQKSSDQ